MTTKNVSVTSPQRAAEPAPLAGPQKAAIIIQMVLSEGGSLPLSGLSASSQSRLMQDFVELGRVDHATLASVVADLERDLAAMGLSFPHSVTDALETLEAHLNPDFVTNLRHELGLATPPSPWGRIKSLPIEKLTNILPEEDPGIAAVILSNLDDEKAAELLDSLPAEQATQVAFAIQKTGKISPEMLMTIGDMLGRALPTEVPRAFPTPPALRLANLLNAASPDRRDAVLADLAEQDQDFAAEVRAAIFTFADIATRIAGPDVAKITRDVAQEDLVKALGYAQTTEAEAAEFILTNMSQRMADALREEITEQGEVAKQVGELAMGKVTSAIRALVDAGDISLLAADAEQEAA